MDRGVTDTRARKLSLFRFIMDSWRQKECHGADRSTAAGKKESHGEDWLMAVVENECQEVDERHMK